MYRYRDNASSVPADLNPQGYRNLPGLIEDLFARYSARPAFTSFGRTLSYAELDRLSAAFAVYLQRDTDLKPGDRIAIQLPNLIQYPVVVFGALRAGLVVVNTNPLYTAAEMEHQFRDSGAKALVIHKSMAHKAEQVIEKTEIRHLFLTQVGDLHGFTKRHLLNAAVKYVKKMEPPFSLPDAIGLRSALVKHLNRRPTPVACEPGDLAILQYTGGTTGVSKGAMLTHANLLSNMLQGQDAIAPAGKDWCDTVISPLPLYHIYAFTVAQIVLACGGHSVLIPDPRNISGFVRELKRWRFSAFLGLNTLFIALCNNPAFRELDFSALKLTLSGGMALTQDALKRWQSVTGCTIVEAYGLTETSPAVSINPPNDVRPGTIGKPVKCTDVQILDSDGQPVIDGAPGELCIKGPQVMAGYWQREEDTEKSFTAEGYLRTGDIAVREPDGYLRIVDRSKDMIIVSGFNVYPNEIEDTVSAHPGVTECAAIGLPDPSCGEIIKIVVVRQDEQLEAEELRAWCRERLTRYKVPKVIEFAEELPKTNVGKIMRRALRCSSTTDEKQEAAHAVD
ncbi:AMP-binding protein [Marinobacterium litorale]|uniref:AMP-binding protein n=1 Tax=Marinobacterium litorale TaxID=404770 RepID=UPI000422632F|nr:AMP-binding protein [Marinobacterium litorale]